MEQLPEYNPAFRTDEEIYEDIIDQLERDSRIDEVDIEIEVTEGIVKLTGQAESAQEAEMAESIIQRIDGVIDVINELFVVQSGHTQEAWPGKDTEAEAELEDIEPLPGDREATEDHMESVEEGLSYVPPDEPSFPTTRNGAFELRRREVAAARDRERRKLGKHDTKKVEGQEL
ncbi:MAG: BON domain-containing protein [Candidatus Aquicultorales bacterium]